jgi:hypothetical protein
MAKNKVKINGKGLGMVATAVAAGAAYYFLGPTGKEHRKDAKSWMKGARKKVVSELKKGKNITKGAYEDIVDKVTSGIKKGATSAEVKAFAKALKEDWRHILAASQIELERAAAKTVRKTASKRKTSSR